MAKKAGAALAERKQNSLQRNYGIDLLRCVAMFLIVVIHIYNQGGLLNAISKKETYYVNYTVRLIALGAVNLYAMISGYVMLHGSFKLRRLIGLWLQVVFWGLALCAVGRFVLPEAISKKEWICAAFPITQKEFWYFSAYVGVFFLSPIINHGILALNRPQAFGLLIGCIGLFSFGTVFGKFYQGDPFVMGSGYSVLWLLVMYIVGACLNHTDFFRRKEAGELLLVMAILLVLCIVWAVLPLRGILGATKKQINSYLNPLMLIFDICLFGLFAKMKLQGDFLRKLIGFLAPLTFSVYIIHVHPLCWALMKFRFTFIAEYRELFYVPLVIAFALAIYLVCSLLDYLRVLLFRLLRMEKLCAATENFLRKNLLKLYAGFAGHRSR
ncbi:MAG: acyltransferase [Clostridia bacterium]|nr:acyltransferase [Clostridia bacterium]